MEYIKEAIQEAKKDIQKLKDEGVYNAEYIRKVELEKQAEIQALAKEYHQNNIYKLQDMKNTVIRKHDPAAIIEDPNRPETKFKMQPEERYKKLLKQSPEMYKLQIEMDQRRGIHEYDVNGVPIVEGAVIESETRKVKTRAQVDIETTQKLLENRRLEAEIKALKTDDLKAELDKVSESKAGSIDRLHLVAAELRLRGEHSTADQLIDRIEAHNVREPWRNDPDFIAAEKEITSQETYIANDDLLFIDEENDIPIHLKDVFKTDEKAEAKKRLQAEVKEYEAAESGSASK